MDDRITHSHSPRDLRVELSKIPNDYPRPGCFSGIQHDSEEQNRYIMAKILSLGVYIDAAGASACITYERKMLRVLLFKFARYFHNCFCVEMIAA
jgi:hypothetical protein